MNCPNCGYENGDFTFCVKCGTKLVYEDNFENENAIMPDDELSFESEKTIVVDNKLSFESEKTVLLDDKLSFEREQTDMLNDEKEEENEEATVIMDSVESEEAEEVLDSDESEEAEEVLDSDESEEAEEVLSSDENKDVPLFEHREDDIVHKPDFQEYYREMAYIEHLRGLKGLLDDGIITEEEFNLKKKQLLGI